MEINRLLNEVELRNLSNTIKAVKKSLKRLRQFACENQFVLDELADLDSDISDIEFTIGGEEDLLEQI